MSNLKKLIQEKLDEAIKSYDECFDARWNQPIPDNITSEKSKGVYIGNLQGSIHSLAYQTTYLVEFLQLLEKEVQS